MLRELAEVGMGLARGVARQAEDAGSGGGDLGLIYARIARAVRQTLALEVKLEGELEARIRQETTVREMALARAPVERRSRTVRRAVGQAIETEADDNDIEALFDERLADREDDADFLDRPVSELVARICKDLGVTPDWSLWEDEDWALEAAAARTPPTPPPPPSGEADTTPTPHTPAADRIRPAGAPSWLSG